MILTVDIGNSNIMFGGFLGDELKFVARISTDTRRTEDEYASIIMNILALQSVDRCDIKGSIICSVVPPLDGVMKKAVKIISGTDSLMVGPGIKTGLNIQVDNPSSVGADLICASVAAGSLYGAPALIVDMGTATKMMVIDKKGAFIGVSIIPGVLMGLNALADRTAQLPRVSLEAPKNIIGKNTTDCMKSGVIFGNAAMVDGMIDRICEELKYDLPVYATGGLASVILPHCRHEITLNEQLVLFGLNVIYKKNA